MLEDNLRPEIWGVDGDIILYSTSFATKDEPVKEALETVRKTLLHMKDKIETEETVVYLTGRDNYRDEYGCSTYPYKGNRKSEKPEHFLAIKEYMIESLGAIVVEGQEADDQLGIDCCTKGHGIATIDKDLWGVPGWHYNWRKEVMDYVSEVEANRFFYTQLLTGDSTDNIPGIFKRTGVKATKDLKQPLEALEDPSEMYQYVRELYIQSAEDASQVDDWLLRQGRQLWIRRKENEMWEPPKDA